MLTVSSKRKGQLFCLDAETGTVKWATDGRAAPHARLQSAGPNRLAHHRGRDHALEVVS